MKEFLSTFFFGRMKTYRVKVKDGSYDLGGRYYTFRESGYLTIYDAWGASVASIIGVESIMEVEL